MANWENTPTYEAIPRRELLREWLLNAWKEWKNFVMIAIVWWAVLSGLATLHDKFLKYSLDKTIEVNGKVIWILDCDIPTRRIISGNFGELWYVIGDIITWWKTCVPITDVTIPVQVKEGASFWYAKSYKLTSENLPDASFVQDVSNVINALKAKGFHIESIKIAPKSSPEWDQDENIKLAESRWQYVLSEIIRVSPELSSKLKVFPGMLGKFEDTDISMLVEIAKRNWLTNPDKVIQKYNDWSILLNEADRDFMKKLLDRTTEIQVNAKVDAVVWMRIMDQWVLLICTLLWLCGFFGTINVASEILETGLVSTFWVKKEIKK